MLTEILDWLVVIYAIGVVVTSACALIAYLVARKQSKQHRIRPHILTTITAITTWPLMLGLFAPLLKSAIGGRKSKQKGKP